MGLDIRDLQKVCPGLFNLLTVTFQGHFFGRHQPTSTLLIKDAKGSLNHEKIGLQRSLIYVTREREREREIERDRETERQRERERDRERERITFGNGFSLSQIKIQCLRIHSWNQ